MKAVAEMWLLFYKRSRQNIIRSCQREFFDNKL